MKKAIYSTIIILCILGLPSCKKEDKAEGGGKLNIELCISGCEAETKAHVSAEKTINSSTIFIFDSTSGVLERVISSSASGDGSISVSENVKSGLKTIWAYANTEVDAAGGFRLQDHPLKGAGLGENDFENNSFAMCGSTAVSITQGSTASASVVLRRKVSRTVVRSIRNNLPSSLPLEICGAFLADVYIADTPEYVSPVPSLWANKWGHGMEYPGLTSWFPSSSVTITGGSTANFSLSASEKGPRMYSMPNPLVSESVSGPHVPGEQWRPRLTKLVIVAKIAGKQCYYTIPLESPAANQSVEYNITVYGVGSDDPEVISSTGSFSANRMVKQWEEGASYIDNSTPAYKIGVITSSPGHTFPTHIGQRMYLQMPVSEMEPEVRSGVSFSAILHAPDGSTSDVSNWITPTFSSGNLLWELNIACRTEGQLEVIATYDGEVIARAKRDIFTPQLSVSVEPLRITGEACPINLMWTSADGASELGIGNTSTATDGAFFDSALYSSLLGGGSIEFDPAWSGSSMLGSHIAGSNRYLRISSLGSMAQIISDANSNGSFSERSLPLIARFRLVTPCGIKSSWADARVCNWWANFYDSGEISEFIYRDNECYNTNVEIAAIADNMAYQSPALTWEWKSRWGYTFGCGNSTPMDGAASRVGISAGKMQINNASSAKKANAAGLSQISASFTNSISGETLAFPCLDVYIYKTFYFGSTVNSNWVIIYSAPDVTAFSADIPVNPVEKPLWSADALQRGADYSGGTVKPSYRSSTSEASQWFSSESAFTRNSYPAGPEDKKHFVHFYTFKPSYEGGTYHSF